MLARRTLFAVIAAVSMSGAAHAAPPAPQPFEQEVFKAALIENRPILVEIFASWCPVCAVQKEHLAAIMADDEFADFVFLEVDFDTRKEVLRSLGAQMQSTLIVYADGEEVSRSVGDTDSSSPAPR